MACANQQVECSSDADSHNLGEKTTHHDGSDHIQGHPHSYAHEPRASKHVHVGAVHEHAHGEDGTHLDEPCNVHLNAAMERYATYLESARCICRSILSSATRIEFCGLQPSASGVAAFSTSHGHHLDMKEYGSVLSRRRLKRAPKVLAATQSEIKCCGSHESLDNIEFERQSAPKTTSVDMEKVAGMSHILLSVTGMDCSGCANNLTRALRGVAGTRNVKVIFISGVAEFDLETEINTLDDVIRSAQRATGYKLTPFSSDTQSIDVTMSAAEASRFRDNLPRGVERCEKLSKTTYEISYDPCITGARDMLAGIDAQLGPVRSDSYLDEGRRRLIRVFALTTAAFVLTTPVVVLEWGVPLVFPSIPL